MVMKFYTASNWGSALEYDLAPGEVAKTLPVALPLVEIDPPAWAMASACKIGGRRHPKRAIVFTMAQHVQHDITGPPRGPLSGAYKGPSEAYNRAIQRRNRKKGQKDTPSIRNLTQRGNLREEDYRLWKGYTLPSETGATCRWCGAQCRSREAMASHHLNQYCKERLLAVYRYAKQQHTKQRYCFACKTETQHFRWGVPLCNTVSCLSRWKFTVKDSWHGFLQYYQWALEAQMHDPINGPFSGLPEGEEQQSGAQDGH